MTSPQPSLTLLLQRATHVTLDALATRLAHLELTAGEINALANLGERDAQLVSELSRNVGTPVTTMTSLLDRLARRGLIARTVPESNRRTVQVSLTPAGRELAREALSTIRALDEELSSGVPEADQLRAALIALTTRPA